MIPSVCLSVRLSLRLPFYICFPVSIFLDKGGESFGDVQVGDDESLQLIKPRKEEGRDRERARERNRWIDR